MTKNRTPTPVYLDPGMHPGLEVKGLKITAMLADYVIWRLDADTILQYHTPLRHYYMP